MTTGLLDDAEASALDTPAVVVDLDRMDARIASMASLMRERGIALRPHAKTHKSIEVARRQIDGRRGRPDGRHDRRGRGLRGRRLHGPVHRLPGDRRRARRRIGCGELAVAMRALGRGGFDRGRRSAGGRHAGRDRPRVRVLIEIDSGGARTGVRPELAGSLARHARDCGLEVVGAFTHEGHGYRGTEQRADGRPRTRSAAWHAAAASLRAEGIEPLVVSAGSTPTADAVGARRRDRGAPGDVCLRRSTAGRAPR